MRFVFGAGWLFRAAKSAPGWLATDEITVHAAEPVYDALVADRACG